MRLTPPKDSTTFEVMIHLVNKYIRQISNGLKVCPYLGPYPALLKGGRAFAEESRPLRPRALPEEQPQPLRIQVRRCREMDSSGRRTRRRREEIALEVF
jgi:hypothetical protein